MGGDGSVSSFGYMTGRGRPTTEQIREAIKNKDKNVLRRAGLEMSMNGTIMPYGTSAAAKNAANKASSQNQTNSSVSIADAIGILNKTLNLVLQSKESKSSAGSNNSRPNVTQQQAPSGISQGISSAGSYVGRQSGTAISNISSNIDSYDAGELKDVLNNDIQPLLSSANSNLNAAKADYNVLLGQKEQASATVSELQTGIHTSETEKDNAQNALKTDKSNLDSSLKARDTMDDQLSALDSEYEGICSDVKEKEGAKSKCQGKVSECKTNVTAAETTLNSANAAYESAQSALSGTPETLEGGIPNPAYAAAKTACDNALKAKEQAEKDLDSANEALEGAECELATAEENLTIAQNTKKEKLTELKKTEGECGKLAEACERNELQVENAQKSYDSSLENFDTCKNNFEKMNDELESAQGILTQCDEYESKIKELQDDVDNAEALKAKAEKALQTKDGGLAKEVSAEADAAKREELKKEILENAAKSEGCSALKTPAENLLSMKNGPYGLNDKARTAEHVGGFEKVDSMGVYVGHPIIYNKSAEYFEEIGCIPNSDGSYTNPENGQTYVNVKDNVWVNTLSLAQNDAEYANMVDPEIRQAGIRGYEQNEGNVHTGYQNRFIELDKLTGRAKLK